MMADKPIDIRRAFAGNEELTDIPDGVIFNNEGDTGETEIDITEAFARNTPFSTEDIGYTHVSNPVMMGNEAGTTEDITNSMTNRSVTNDGDPEIFSNENYTERGSGNSAVDVLPFATKTSRGIVIIGTNIDVLDGVISVATANGSTLGLVKAGNNISIANGVISVATATTTSLGLVKGGGPVTIESGVIKVNVTGGSGSLVTAGTNVSVSNGVISVATANGSTLGVAKAGTNVTVTNGAINVATGSTTALGVLRVGNNIDYSNGIISLSPASSTKLGLVKAGANITIDEDGTINGVNSYVHPPTHPATIIVQDATHRFVTDTQISTWNGKANTSGTYTGLIVGSANKLTTARTLTIGNTGKTFDGTANVTWSISEIGAAPASHTHSYLPLSGGTITGMITRSLSSSWIAGRDTAILNMTTGDSSYGSFVRHKGSTHTFTMGSLGNSTIGFYLYSNSRTENATDGSLALGKDGNVTASGNITAKAFVGPLSGNASTASKLATGRTISLTGDVTGSATFDGSTNISITATVGNDTHTHAWANITGKPSSFTPSTHNQASNTITAMTGYVKATTATAIAATDSLNVAIGKLEKYLDGKANTSGTYTGLVVGKANQLTTARTFTFTGGATGSGSFNGTGNVSIALTVANDSHTHDGRYYTESEINSKLGGYLPLSGGTITGNLTVNGSLAFSRIVVTGTGNDYSSGGVEIKGNGTTNTVFPTLGFHQPNKYATSIQCRAAAQISFYAQGASAYATTFHATVNATGDVVGYYSDRRMKKDFVPVTGAIDKMWKVSPYYYVQNEVAERLGYEHNETRQIGFIAQQMERIFPEVVKDAAINHLASTNEEVRKMIEEGGKIKTIKYERLVPVLWSAILELDEEVKKLKDESRNK